MSATNRGSTRVESDFYETPSWCVRRLLERVTLMGAVLEPCAGNGAIIKVDCAPRERWSANDIRAESVTALFSLHLARVTAQDALTLDLSPYNTIITNPPFGLFAPLMRHFVENAPQATVILLGRLNLLGAGIRDGRSEWLRNHMPDVYVLPNRPEFVASDKCVEGVLNGLFRCNWRQTANISSTKPEKCPNCGNPHVSRSTTDATEYAWFVWRGWSHDSGSGCIQILADTSREERALG